jgi:hypothetical protein
MEIKITDPQGHPLDDADAVVVLDLKEDGLARQVMRVYADTLFKYGSKEDRQRSCDLKDRIEKYMPKKTGGKGDTKRVGARPARKGAG